MAGYNFGQSFIWLAQTRFNCHAGDGVYQLAGRGGEQPDAWTNSLFLSPGVRWSYNLRNGLQIVPGIGVPLGLGPSDGEKAIFLYISFEHPFRKLPEQ